MIKSKTTVVSTTGDGRFHFLHSAFSSQFKSKVGIILTKDVTLRVNLNLDGFPSTSRAYTHPSHSETTRLNLVSIFRCYSPPHNPVYTRRVDPSVLVLVFHHTDTHTLVFSLTLVLSIHNKQHYCSDNNCSDKTNKQICLFHHLSWGWSHCYVL
jgi:hypothetical protein